MYAIRSYYDYEEELGDIFDAALGRALRRRREVLARYNNEDGKGYLRQIYQRDTGETMWDVSAPVYVRGQHWGGFVITSYSIHYTKLYESWASRPARASCACRSCRR